GLVQRRVWEGEAPAEPEPPPPTPLHRPGKRSKAFFSRALARSGLSVQNGRGRPTGRPRFSFSLLVRSGIARIRRSRDRGRQRRADTAAGNSMLTGVSSPARTVTSFVTTTGLLSRVISALKV